MEFAAQPKPVPPFLPQNFLPVALPAFQGAHEFAHVLVPFDTNAPLTKVSADALREFTSFEYAEAPSILGPRANLQTLENPPQRPYQIESAPDYELVLAVIDTGIAFWNPAFCQTEAQPETNVFHRMGYMSLNGAKDTDYEVGYLCRNQILGYCASGPSRANDQNVVRSLACKFEECAFASGLAADAFSHGTAMADRVLRPSLAGGRAPKTVGLELPYSAFADFSGSTLHAVLPRALAAVSDMAREVVVEPGKKPYVICVLSYGATGKPFDQSGPFAAALAQHFGGVLYVPMGNHLQDQLHAQLDPGQSVHWMLPADDTSANTVDIHGEGDVPDMTLHTPGGVDCAIPKAARQLSLLQEGTGAEVKPLVQFW